MELTKNDDGDRSDTIDSLSSPRQIRHCRVSLHLSRSTTPSVGASKDDFHKAPFRRLSHGDRSLGCFALVSPISANV